MKSAIDRERDRARKWKNNTKKNLSTVTQHRIQQRQSRLRCFTLLTVLFIDCAQYLTFLAYSQRNIWFATKPKQVVWPHTLQYSMWFIARSLCVFIFGYPFTIYSFVFSVHFFCWFHQIRIYSQFRTFKINLIYPLSINAVLKLKKKQL